MATQLLHPGALVAADAHPDVVGLQVVLAGADVRAQRALGLLRGAELVGVDVAGAVAAEERDGPDPAGVLRGRRGVRVASPRGSMSRGTRSATARLFGSTSWKDSNGSPSVWLISRPRKPVQSMNRSPAMSPCSRVARGVIQPRSSWPTSSTSSRTCRTPRSVPYAVRKLGQQGGVEVVRVGELGALLLQRGPAQRAVRLRREQAAVEEPRASAWPRTAQGVTKQLRSNGSPPVAARSHQSARLNPSTSRSRSNGW